MGCSTNFTPLGCHSDVPITHGPNLTLLKSGSDAPIMYNLKFTSVVCHSNIPIPVQVQSRPYPKGHAMVT